MRFGRTLLATSLLGATAVALPTHETLAKRANPNYCAIALPPALFGVSGPHAAIARLTGGGAAMILTLFGGRGLDSSVARAGGPKNLPENDSVADFALTIGKHTYAGPIHVFAHATSSTICRTGNIMVDGTGNTTQSNDPNRIPLKVKGTLVRGVARATVWVNGGTYKLQGPIKTG